MRFWIAWLAFWLPMFALLFPALWTLSYVGSRWPDPSFFLTVLIEGVSLAFCLVVVTVQVWWAVTLNRFVGNQI